MAKYTICHQVDDDSFFIWGTIEAESSAEAEDLIRAELGDPNAKVTAWEGTGPYPAELCEE